MRTRFIAVAFVAAIVMLALSPRAILADMDPPRAPADVDPPRAPADVGPPRAPEGAAPSPAVLAGAATSRPGPHLRPLTGAAAAFLADAIRQSPVVRGLVERLAETDVVVYLAESMDGCDPDLRACLSFVVSAAGARYLIVRSDRWLVSPWDRIAWLAHELEHAMEIAGAPEVQDPASLARFYRRIGWQGGAGRFETSQARATGDLVRQQLAGIRR